jgi:hypothetical protein
MAEQMSGTDTTGDAAGGYFTIEGPKAVIEELSAAAPDYGLTVSQPRSTASPFDVLQAPISGSDMKEEWRSVVVYVEAVPHRIHEWLRKTLNTPKKPEESSGSETEGGPQRDESARTPAGSAAIRLQNPSTGARYVLTANSSDEEIVRMFSR